MHAVVPSKFFVVLKSLPLHTAFLIYLFTFLFIYLFIIYYLKKKTSTPKNRLLAVYEQKNTQLPHTIYTWLL